MNTGRSVQSAVNGMDSFQKMNAVASSVKGLWMLITAIKIIR